MRICIVCIGMYIHAHVLFLCAVATLSRGALLFLAYLCNLFAVSSLQPFRSLFARYLSRFSFFPFQSDYVPCSCGHVCRTFAQTFATFILYGFEPF